MKILIFGLFFVIGTYTVKGNNRYRNQYQSPQPLSQIDKCESRINQLKTHLDRKINAFEMDIQANRNHASKVQTDNYFALQSKLEVIESNLNLLSIKLLEFGQNLSNIANSNNEIHQQHEITNSIHEVFGNPSILSPPSSSNSPASSCLEIKQKNPKASSNIYQIQTNLNKKPFWVLCDMSGKNGGWLTIQHRSLGNEDFYRNWQDYKMGFGNIAGDHWLGLEHIHELTGSEMHELLIQLRDVDDIETYARYTHFSIGSEDEGYAIKVLAGYTGTANDSLMYHAGSKFSTHDKDQDSWSEGNCAQSHGGAWWYKSCDKSNLNGRYMPGQQSDLLIYQPMYWATFTGPQAGLKSSRMLIRPRQDTAIN